MTEREELIMKRAGSFWQEFKRFAVKGNALDLAIAVVVGNAFSKIVNGLVSDLILPLVGLFGSGASLENYSLVLRPAYVNAQGQQVPADVLAYGDFIQSIVSFLIVAGSIFVVFKLIAAARNRIWRREEETPPAQKSDEVKLLEEIRDLLKSGARPQ